MERHFTVTGFVVEGDRTLLHWHQKLQLWLPPGGHIDPDEDPVQAVVREVREETGIAAEVVPHARAADVRRTPPQLPSPLAIIVADVAAGAAHQHIDMSYVAAAARRRRRAASRTGPRLHLGDRGASCAATTRCPSPRAASTSPSPEDVRVIGLQAIELVRAGRRPEPNP